MIPILCCFVLKVFLFQCVIHAKMCYPCKDVGRLSALFVSQSSPKLELELLHLIYVGNYLLRIVQQLTCVQTCNLPLCLYVSHARKGYSKSDLTINIKSPYEGNALQNRSLELALFTIFKILCPHSKSSLMLTPK